MDRIGIAAWNFNLGSLPEKLRLFAELGYTAASINNNLMDTLSPDEEAAANRVIEEYDLILTFHGGFSKPNEPLDEDLALRRAERIFRWHKRTGRVLNTSYDVPNGESADGTRRKAPEQIIGVLRKVLERFASTDIRVLLEDCPLNAEAAGFFGKLTKEYPHLGILIDLGHMNIRLHGRSSETPLAPGSVEKYLRDIPWEIAELHVHSNDGSKDQHGPPYMPNADLVTAAKVLKDLGFHGVSTIELVPAWCGLPEEEIVPACRKSLEYWRGLMEGTECTQAIGRPTSPNP